MDRIQIVQDVQVTTLTANGSSLVEVELMRRDEPVARVSWRFDDPAGYREQLALLMAWHGDGRPLAFLRREGQAALLDERELLGRALRGAA